MRQIMLHFVLEKLGLGDFGSNEQRLICGM